MSVTVEEGVVIVRNSSEEARLGAGQTATLRSGNPHIDVLEIRR
jgi:ferric-dicitrate binding protein FerR (iron transport regulator)